MADIELIVKIPEEIYKASQIIDVKHEDVIQIPLEVITNGTPLPKGHDRLVEAHAVVKALFDFKTIDDVPTIIEADKESK